MKEEKVEYYTIRPNLKQIYGRKVDKTTIFDEKTDDGSVRQHFENLTLTTKILKKYKANKENPYEYKEKSEIKIKVPENSILIWSEEEGFILPQYQMCILEDIEKEIKDLKDIYNNDEKGDKA